MKREKAVKRTNPRSIEAIPSVDFYGKDESWPTSESLHSEPLVDRSARHNWIIRAHRHSNQTQIFMLLEGSGSARLDSVRCDAIAPSVLVIPERCVHEFAWSSDCGGFVLSLASPLIARVRRRSVRIDDVLARAAVYRLEDEGALLGSIFNRIHGEYAGDHPLRELALETLLVELAIALARTAAVETESVIHAGRSNRHFRRFLELIEQRHKSQWPLAQYAGVLGITPPHLNALCRRHGGRSAKQLVHDRLLLAARRRLAYTDVSVAGIARSLGFADPSYFARFFRRCEGVTPSMFRRQTGTQSASGQ
jgi:AraC family transcriptional activator of pobA